jgi:hypothetical protein
MNGRAVRRWRRPRSTPSLTDMPLPAAAAVAEFAFLSAPRHVRPASQLIAALAHRGVSKVTFCAGFGGSARGPVPIVATVSKYLAAAAVVERKKPWRMRRRRPFAGRSATRRVESRVAFARYVRPTDRGTDRLGRASTGHRSVRARERSHDRLCRRPADAF